MGDQEKAEEILGTVQWKTRSFEFQICERAILGRFDDCVDLIREHGDSIGLNKFDFHDWPVFSDLRNDPSFQQAFEEKFGEPLGGQVLISSDDEELDD